jgi:hypothetical protein
VNKQKPKRQRQRPEGRTGKHGRVPGTITTKEGVLLSREDLDAVMKEVQEKTLHTVASRAREWAEGDQGRLSGPDALRAFAAFLERRSVDDV